MSADKAIITLESMLHSTTLTKKEMIVLLNVITAHTDKEVYETVIMETYDQIFH